MSLTSPMLALVKREFVSTIRGTRSYVILLLFVVFCMGAVVWMWPAEQRLFMEAGELSRTLITSMIMLLLAACGILVPALGATSIVVEREQDTFDTLRTTLIRPSGIVVGKLLNTVGFFLLMFVAALPVISSVFFLLGLDWIELAEALTVLLVTAMSCAMVGILSSAWFKRTFVAIGAAYVGVLIAVFSPALASIVAGVFMYVFRMVLPFAPMRMFQLGWTPLATLDGIFGQRILPGEFLATVIYQFVFSAVCLHLTLRVLRKPPSPPKIDMVKPIDDPVILWRRRTTWPFYLIDPLARRKPIEDGRNAMLVREIRWGARNRGTLFARTFIISFAVWFLASFPVVSQLGSLEAATMWFVEIMVGTVAIAPAFLASALTKEYELGNIDMLRMTLLTPREIMMGKLAAGVTVVAPLFCSALLASAALLAARAYQWSMLLVGYSSLLLCIALSVSLALFASLLTKRSSTALVLSYLFTIVVFGASFVVRVFLDLPLGRADAPNSLLLMLGSPIINAMYVMPRRREEYVHFVPWLLNAALYGAVCYFLIRLSIRKFERERVRDV